jgi:NACalpha-BTF3-like transcription factor
MEKQAQDKQLDSVTDRVQEKDVGLDTQKALQAVSGLHAVAAPSTAAAMHGSFQNEDVALIVNELDVTEEAAEKALQQVVGTVQNGESLVAAALRKLVMT